MKQNKLARIGIIILVTLVLGFIDLSPATKQAIFPFLPDAINQSDVNLGLDLQGGAQLDYKVDLRKVPETDQDQIVEGVKAVIERRVNSLGVAEPNIYEANVAGERHIVVELAGIHDLEEAKATVGKTIQLEFKERKTEEELNDPNYKDKVRAQAQGLIDKIKGGEDFTVVAEAEQQSFQGKVIYDKQEELTPLDKIFPPAGFTEEQLAEIKTLPPGSLYDKVVEGESFFDIFKILEYKEEQKEVKKDHEVTTSHILVSYQGSERADASVTRTKEQARARAEEALQKARAEGADFVALAKEYSDGPSADKGGILSTPVKEGGAYVEEYTKGSLALQEGQISDIVETKFGFHVIKADKVQQASTETTTENLIKYERIIFDNQPDPWKSTGLTGEHFVRADADFGSAQIDPIVNIRFNDEGAKLFGDITERNLQKQIAIFVGGDYISAPTVQTKIDNGEAVISGLRDIKEAQRIARELNTGAIPAPIVLTGQYTIGATLGHEALATSLEAGIIGLALVALYMLIYYRLLGLMAVFALTIYSIVLLFLIKIALPLAAALLISIVAFIWMVAKIVNSQDKGWEKVVSLGMATFGLFFMSFLLSTSVVLTLAGVAGVILSIGMAVDANILIFERMKEELKNGRPFSSALELGFNRAWTSIRDSNFSSLITCGILFYVGTSIIKGFAFNLAAGIVVSMLTAIIITRGFLQAYVGTKTSKKTALFISKPEKKSDKVYRIVENSKVWFGLSGIVIGASIFALATFGLKLGIDFTGGTLMELQFENEVTKAQVETALTEIETKLKEDAVTPTPAEPEGPLALIPTALAQSEAPTATEPTATETIAEETVAPIKTEESAQIDATEEAKEEIDFSNASVVSSDNGYLIKLKHLSETTHEKLKKELENKLGKFEETRFNTVGPTVGSTMKYRAIVALIIALIVIVLYISFAFRKIPKEYSPWRFGASAIIALTHDVIIAAGIFAVLGQYLNVEIDILFITALLTILGFSVHDTIVVLDRLRENLRTKEGKESFTETTNKALTQTMARSINTSVSTLITLLALYFLGSTSIQWFVLALIIGTIVGTYSSIFTASPILVAWHKLSRRK